MREAAIQNMTLWANLRLMRCSEKHLLNDLVGNQQKIARDCKT